MKKNVLASLIFKILVKGINGANLYDTRVQDEVAGLPENFIVSLQIFPYGEYVAFKINKHSVQRVKNYEKADLEIIFKNNKCANRALLGRESIAKSFSCHSILLKGDIYKAMVLVRIINLVENYLFPKWYTKALPRYEKQFCSLKLYMYVLFGNSKKQRKVK